jgi:hypothetical protein
MVILNQLFVHPFAMLGGSFKDECNRILIDVKNSCGSANANAFRESFEYTIDCLFICMKTGEDAIVATAELPAAF